MMKIETNEDRDPEKKKKTRTRTYRVMKIQKNAIWSLIIIVYRQTTCRKGSSIKTNLRETEIQRKIQYKNTHTHIQSNEIQKNQVRDTKKKNKIYAQAHTE